MKTPALLLLFSLPLFASLAMAQQASAQIDKPHITVNGEAVVSVTPDKIVITLGIETTDGEIMAARQKNSAIFKNALLAFKECGATEKDIQTNYLSIQPWKRNNYVGGPSDGYIVLNTIGVTIADVTKIDDLVTKALQAGVNYVYGIDMQTTEFKKYRAEARKNALEAAKEKAEKMAAVLGQSLGDPIVIEENASNNPYGGYFGMRSAASNSQVTMPSDPGELPQTAALGKVTLRANVRVTFELKK